MKLLTIPGSLGENYDAQMLESAHGPGDRGEEPRACISDLMRPGDSSFCAKNSRTKHNMVKDAKVGKSLHSEKKVP